MIRLGELTKTPGETWVAHAFLVYAACALGRVIGWALGSPLLWALALGSVATVLYAGKEVRDRTASWQLARREGRAKRHDGIGDLTLPVFAWAHGAVQPLYPTAGFWLAGVAALGWLAGQVYYRWEFIRP